jgi:hypothetical protein
MRRYFDLNNAVVLPDTPFTRDINASNKLAFVICNGDKANILLHNRSLDVTLKDADINKDDYGWFIGDFYDDED